MRSMPTRRSPSPRRMSRTPGVLRPCTEIPSTGTLVRTTVDGISVQGRNTQGVRLIRLGEGERLVGIERIESLEGEDGEAGAEAAPGATPPDAQT